MFTPVDSKHVHHNGSTTCSPPWMCVDPQGASPNLQSPQCSTGRLPGTWNRIITDPGQWLASRNVTLTPSTTTGCRSSTTLMRFMCTWRGEQEFHVSSLFQFNEPSTLSRHCRDLLNGLPAGSGWQGSTAVMAVGTACAGGLTRLDNLTPPQHRVGRFQSRRAAQFGQFV